MRIYLYICLVMCLVACTKEDDYKKYVNGEERIYRAKPSQLKILPGFLKAGVKFKLYSPIHVEKYEIYADNVKVAEGPVQYADSLEIEAVINNLLEKTYQIDVVTIDDTGLSSIKASGFLNVYGSRYQSTINQRIISKISSPGPGEVEIQYGEAEANVVKSKVRYLKVNGEIETKFINRDQSVLRLTDVDPTGYLKYSTDILPSPVSLDAIATEEVTVQMSNVEQKWFSSEERTGEGANNGRIAHMFDNNLSTFWHTQYTGGTLPYPHWFIIDMGIAKSISTVFVSRRTGSNTLPTKIKLEMKNIGGTWESLGEYSLQNLDGEQQINVSSNVSGRFLKVTALQGPTTHTCIAEFKVM